MLRAGIVSVLLVISPAVAQEVVDTSGSNLSPEDLEATLSSVSVQLPDPLSAEFRSLFHSKSGLVCGEVNGKDETGADLGWMPFGYNTDGESVTLLADPTSLAGAADAAMLSEGGCTWSGEGFAEHRSAE
jgi:hypothetical protein